MKKYYQYKNVADAYKDLLNDLLYHPEYVNSPRGIMSKEITNVIVEIENPCNNLFINNKRSSPIKYICAELIWYFSGSNTSEFISKYASMWNNLKNANGTINSAYGYLLFCEKNMHDFTQYQWAIESLKKDKNSRQAFFHFNNSSHQFFENKDQVCTIYGIFQIRKNCLNLTIAMRSNDVILGFMTDFAFFNVLHQQAHRHLLQYYPDLKIGKYIHITNSMHLYEKNFKLAEEMLLNPFLVSALPRLDCDLITENGSPSLYNSDSDFLNFIHKQL